jgi:hypothetical protein
LPQSGKIQAFYGSLFGSEFNMVFNDTAAPTLTVSNAGSGEATIIDKYASAISSSRRLLVSPDAYNVLIAFTPTCEFMDRVEEAITLRYPQACKTLF